MTPRMFRLFWRSAAAFLLVLLTVSPQGELLAAAGDVTRVSVDSNGAQADAISYRGQISANGRFAVFESDAANLVPGDTNGTGDVFLRDLQLRTTVLVSVDTAGGQANSGSGMASVSADGRFVAFESSATNLVEGDTNGFTDIFVKDMLTGAVTRVSVSSGGLQSDGESADASISGDGRYVAFGSDAGNLVPNDLNGTGDVFVHDMQTGATLWASPDANGPSWDPTVSQDGRFVVFTSNANNLVGDDTNGKTDVFVFSIYTGQVTRESLSSNGEQGDMASLDPSISGDGRYVSFSSSSHNFMSGDTYELTYVYIRDRQTGQTTLASFKDGYQMVGWSDATVMSADGRYVAFSFDDKGDSMPRRWLYIHDRVSRLTYLAVSGGSDWEHNPLLPSISGDGRLLLFATSGALVPDDTNNERDIYVKEMSYPPDLVPTVVSTEHGCPNGCTSSADQVVDFLVKFSESVTGVDAGDFVLATGGGISGAAITAVSGGGSDYVVRVDTGTGDGTIRLDVVDDDSIRDVPQNPLGGVGAGNGNFTTGGVYTVDKSIVAVTGILRLDPNPNAEASMRFAVNFSEAVTGVDPTDFLLATTGAISGASVIEVSGSGTSYTVAVNTGAGEGTLRLDLVDDDSIVDGLSIPLGGLGMNTGNFASGEVYTIDRSVPAVSSILRTDPHPTAAGVVHFNVTFSEPVSGVDGADFALVTSGVTGAAMTEIVVAGNVYTIAVNTGSGNGAIRLDVVDDDSIVDSSGKPLGGAGIGNGNFTGETYTVTKITYVILTERLRSNGTNDGWIREGRENLGAGGTKNSTGETLLLGDDRFNRQYRSILHFPTHYLPDNAVLTKAILTLKLQSRLGTDPFTTLGNISIDIRYGPFGSFGPFGIKALQATDFQEPASLNAVGAIPNNPVGGWYWTMLDPSAFPYINLTGTTQLRLAFQSASDFDLQDDILLFYSGDYPDQSERPHLLIEYYVP